MTEKSNHADRKKVIIAVAALALLCASILVIRGINAYLTDRETVANTFTVGEVTIDALEPNYPGNGSDETEDVLPLEEIKKDPCVCVDKWTPHICTHADNTYTHIQFCANFSWADRCPDRTSIIDH